MNDIKNVKPIPNGDKDKIILAWAVNRPDVADKLDRVKNDGEFRQVILEAHAVGERKVNEADLLNRVGG